LGERNGVIYIYIPINRAVYGPRFTSWHKMDPEMNKVCEWAESGELSARGLAKALPNIAADLRTTRRSEADAESFAENLVKHTL
jgi:hypothetical protein